MHGFREHICAPLLFKAHMGLSTYEAVAKVVAKGRGWDQLMVLFLDSASLVFIPSEASPKEVVHSFLDLFWLHLNHLISHFQE